MLRFNYNLINKQIKGTNLITNRLIHSFNKRTNDYIINFTTNETLTDQEIKKIKYIFSFGKMKVYDNDEYNSSDDVNITTHIIYKLWYLFSVVVSTSTVMFVNDKKNQIFDISDIILTTLSALIFPTTTIAVSCSFISYYKYFYQQDKKKITE